MSLGSKEICKAAVKMALSDDRREEKVSWDTTLVSFCDKTLFIASSMEIDVQSIVEGLKNCPIEELLDTLYDDDSVFYYHVVDGLRKKDSQFIKKISESSQSLWESLNSRTRK